MRYLHYSEQEKPSYRIAILAPQLHRAEIEKEYITPFGIDKDDILAISLHQAEDKKKTPVKEIKQYIEEELIPTFNDMKIEYLLVADSDYFKALTKQTKSEANLGYVLDCAYGPWKVVYLPSYRQIFYDPDAIRAKIKQAMTCVVEHFGGAYSAPGTDIIKFEAYPKTDADIEEWLVKLIEMGKPLAADIEGFSLKHHSCGIGTISFAWSKHEGIAFPVDYVTELNHAEGTFGKQVRNEPRRKLLKRFFELCAEYNIKLTWHKSNFDIYVLIYQLWMENVLDTANLLTGLEIMTKLFDDTILIAYLATNSCAGNNLSLKDLSQEFAGNYAMTGEDIKDIRRIPLDKLLRYNLVDSCSTVYVEEKYTPIMIQDEQQEIYETLFKPAMVDIIQMQLTGMPVNMVRAKKVNQILQDELEAARLKIMSSPLVQKFTREYLDVEHMNKRNAKLKAKRIELGDEPQEFNPNSDPQKRALFFDFLKLPHINYTKSKMPSTDGETVEALLNRTEDPEIKAMLEGFQLYEIINVLTTNFMPSILGSVLAPDGWHYLFGYFNLGGTISGRLSSSGPNLQNLPSTGKGHPMKLRFAKLIKSCFQAPPGWLFMGIDFSSLEDRISALTTKDPNKLKVYTDGYDGHSLRAYAYFPDQMPDIVDTVESINSIAKKYKPLRDKSKNPTFTLTYQGTFHALVKKYGFTPEQAKDIEHKYHELYKVSDAWVDSKLKQASQTGYVTVAFGLRLRTPLLYQTIRGTGATPYEAEAEGRTAGNALGQSWCLLNSRAWIEFMRKVRQEQYRLLIRPCAQIHDAGYAMIKDDIEIVEYCNEHLVKCVQWQDDPEIWHDEVKLGGEVSIFYPSWEKEYSIPNNATRQQIFDAIEAAS